MRLSFATVEPYLAIIRFNKPIGTLLLLWPTLWALWIAHQGLPSFTLGLIFTAGVFLMRSAGCIINDIADRHIDGHVQRTRLRPLVIGALSLKQALTFLLVLLLLAFGLVLMTNTLTIALAFVGALLALVYPYSKRVIHMPQAMLGLAFAWGVPMAFAATLNTIPLHAWFLFVIAAVWPMVYDSMYAMVDREDDIKVGIYSSARLFGQWDRVCIGALQFVVLGLLIAYGALMQMSVYYYLGLMVAGLLSLYQQRLIAKRQPAECFRAFLNNQWFGLTVLLGIIAGLR